MLLQLPLNLMLQLNLLMLLLLLVVVLLLPRCSGGRVFGVVEGFVAEQGEDDEIGDGRWNLASRYRLRQTLQLLREICRRDWKGSPWARGVRRRRPGGWQEKRLLLVVVAVAVVDGADVVVVVAGAVIVVVVGTAGAVVDVVDVDVERVAVGRGRREGGGAAAAHFLL